MRPYIRRAAAEGRRVLAGKSGHGRPRVARGPPFRFGEKRRPLASTCPRPLGAMRLFGGGVHPAAAGFANATAAWAGFRGTGSAWAGKRGAQ